MVNWLDNQKQLSPQNVSEEELPVVTFEQLSDMKKVCYNLVKKNQIQKKQLLLIINGTAGI